MEATAQVIAERVITLVIGAVDLNAMLARIDLNAVLSRVDIEEPIDRIQINEVLARIDLNALLAHVDLNAVLKRVDLEDPIDRVDLNGLLDRVDVNQIVQQVDVNEVIAKVDLDAVLDQRGAASHRPGPGHRGRDRRERLRQQLRHPADDLAGFTADQLPGLGLERRLQLLVRTRPDLRLQRNADQLRRGRPDAPPVPGGLGRGGQRRNDYARPDSYSRAGADQAQSPSVI